jgi:hypothetical protein
MTVRSNCEASANTAAAVQPRAAQGQRNARNHALVANGVPFHGSPAFDLVPNPDIEKVAGCFDPPSFESPAPDLSGV